MRFGFLNYGHGELGMYSCHTIGKVLTHKLSNFFKRNLYCRGWVGGAEYPDKIWQFTQKSVFPVLYKRFFKLLIYPPHFVVNI